MNPHVPIFVKVDNNDKVIDVIHSMRESLDKIHTLLLDIDQIKNQEANELQSWKQLIHEVDQKIQMVDHSLFSTEGF